MKYPEPSELTVALLTLEYGPFTVGALSVTNAEGTSLVNAVKWIVIMPWAQLRDWHAVIGRQLGVDLRFGAAERFAGEAVELLENL